MEIIYNKSSTSHSSGLKLIILPCREPIHSEILSIYNKSYLLWKNVWEKTLKKLDNLDRLFSNEFTRHDFATVITLDDRPLSLMCYSEVDLSLTSRLDDSWFQSWPKPQLEKMAKLKGLGLFATWFCTDPDYRKSSDNNINPHLSQAIIEIFGKVVLEGNYNRGYGITRNNRGVDKYSKAAGSITIATGIDHNCEVNFVEFIPAKIKLKQQDYLELTKELWNNREDHYFRRKSEQYRTIRKTA